MVILNFSFNLSVSSKSKNKSYAYTNQLLWDRRVVMKVEAYTGEFVVAVSFRNVDDDFAWAFEGVYGPNLDVEGDLFGRSWLASLVCGTCLGV
jgi:hypothetical protein